MNKNSISENQKKSRETYRCNHCRNEVVSTIGDGSFCCQGCSAAYRFIKNLGAGDFYGLLQGKAIQKVKSHEDHLTSAWDSEEFAAEFVQQPESGFPSIQLYIKEIECYACVWLLKKVIEEKFPESEFRASLSRKEAVLTFNAEKTSLSKIIRMMNSLGYNPEPSFRSKSGADLGADLIRIGVSAFCLANLMLFSLPEYFDPNLAESSNVWGLFRWLSFALGTVAVTYCATPFYKKGLGQILGRRISVDLPISLAIIATYILSVVNVLRLEGPIYFDSLAMILFLLLTGRYLQRRVFEIAERKIRAKFSFRGDYITRLKTNIETVIPISSLEKQDIFVIRPGEASPVDAKIVLGKGEVNYEQISGEFQPIFVEEGSLIRSGAVANNARFELESLESGSRSYVARVRETLDRISSDQGRYSKVSDRLASVFFLVLLISVGCIVGYHWQISPAEAVERGVSALLIACPCAFALSVPLTMSMAAAHAAKSGIIFKGQQSIEALAKAKTIFFDKTGTLTQGHPEIVDAVFNLKSLKLQLPCRSGSCIENDLKSALGMLWQFSNHHMVLALQEKYKTPSNSTPIAPINVRETQGKGLDFVWNKMHFKLGSESFVLSEGSKQNQQLPTEMSISGSTANLFLTYNEEIIAALSVEDPLREDAQQTIQNLKDLSINIGIISGDTQERAENLASELNISQSHIFGHQTAFDKLEKLKQFKQQGKDKTTAMVGNGFNDNLAMSIADVSIAVGNASQSAKNAAAINLEENRLELIVEALRLSRRSIRKIYVSFFFAVCFNIVGLSLAAVGLMSPVAAAILMPVSSIIVTAISTIWIAPKESVK